MIGWMLAGFGLQGFCCSPNDLKPVLNWANVCLPEHTSDTLTNYDLFLN